jgi:D-alanyl-D-alanine carboxypeptidase
MARSEQGQPVGHNGGGPGYTASAFHDPATGATACVMAAVEDGFDAQAVVSEILGVS